MKYLSLWVEGGRGKILVRTYNGMKTEKWRSMYSIGSHQASIYYGQDCEFEGSDI